MMDQQTRVRSVAKIGNWVTIILYVFWVLVLISAIAAPSVFRGGFNLFTVLICLAIPTAAALLLLYFEYRTGEVE